MKKLNTLAGVLLATEIALGVAGAAQDSNGKGDPSRESTKVAAGEKDAKKLLLLMDKDANGFVSKQEFSSYMDKEFDHLDKNKSGELDVKELRRLRERDSNQGSGEKQEKIAAGEKDTMKLLLLMDKNANGMISKQEFKSFMDAEFDRMDKDKSGELDANELTQLRVRTRQQISR